MLDESLQAGAEAPLGLDALAKVREVCLGSGLDVLPGDRDWRLAPSIGRLDWPSVG